MFSAMLPPCQRHIIQEQVSIKPATISVPTKYDLHAFLRSYLSTRLHKFRRPPAGSVMTLYLISVSSSSSHEILLLL